METIMSDVTREIPGLAWIKENQKDLYAGYSQMISGLRSGLAFTEKELQEFFAIGMLINIMAAIDLLSIPEQWAQNLMPDRANAIQTASRLLEAQRRAAEAPDQEVSA